jgi:hypothetical protein
MSFPLRTAKEIWFMKKKFHNGHLFCGLLIMNLVILWFYKQHIFNYELFYNLLKGQMDLARIGLQVENMKRWFDLNYILLPVTMLIRFTLVSFILQFPLLFYLDDVPFARVFRIVMVASVSISAGSMIQGLLLLSEVNEMLTVERVNQMPFSVAGLIHKDSGISNSTFMVMNQFNVFELIWCIIIYYKFKAQLILRRVDIILLILGVWLFLLILQWLVIEMVTLLST